MDRDRNLLFGVLAVQLRRLSPSQLVEAAAAWAVDPSRELAERLVATGALSVSDRELVERLVDEAVAVHEGNVTNTLEAFGGDIQVAQTFRGAITRQATGGVKYSQGHTVPSRSRGASFDPSGSPVEETPGRYTGASEHGRGGIGRVLLVHDKVLCRDVALKELLPEPGGDLTDGGSPVRQSAEVVSRFLQEARVTGQLEHPSIVPVYELGTRNDGRVYYTMKLVRGRSLAETLAEVGSLSERLELLPRLVDLCQAMAYAHNRGVIHRDLKPGNVMVGEFGETVVIDWGLAKVRGHEDVHSSEIKKTLQAFELGDGGKPARTARGVALGTPVYMAPEQARGEVELMDERTDIYALGAILYELLTGRPPFKGKSVAGVLSQVRNAQPQSVTKLEPATPRELAAICERAMAKEPGERYTSAKALADELHRFLSGALVQAYHYGFTEHLKRFIRRHRARVAIGAGFTLILIAVLTGSAIWNLRERHRAEQEAAAAKYVSDFLQGVFEVSDPSTSRGNTVTARELLDRAAQEIEHDLSEQPLLQARMMSTMGVVYRSLGLYEHATPLLEGALNLRREQLPGPHLDLAQNLDDLGELLRVKGELDAAENLFVEALSTRRHLLGEEHPLVAASTNNLALLLADKGAYEAAEPLYREALEVQRRLLGDSHIEVGSTLNNLALVLQYSGDLGAAEPLFREALAIHRQAVTDDHPDLAAILNNLATTLRGTGELEAAEDLCRESLEMTRRLVGNEHPDVATSLSNLAWVLQAQDDFGAAESLLREALAIQRRVFGDRHPDVARTLNNLAVILRTTGEFDSAEPLSRESLAIVRRLLGDQHPHVASSLMTLASVLHAMGDLHEARSAYREALEIRENSLPPGHPKLQKTAEQLASILRETGRAAEADELEARVQAAKSNNGRQ